MNVVQTIETYQKRSDLVFFDHFTNLVTGDLWTTLVADTTPTVTIPDVRGGVARLFTDTTDNNEVAIRTTAELFKPAAGKPLWCAGSIQYSENDTNKANVAFGFMSALAANTIADNGANIRASGSVFMIYKLDGATVWRCHSRNGSDSTDTASTVTAGGSTAQILEIFINDFSTTQCSVCFKVDGYYLTDSDGRRIVHRVAYASNTEMNFGIYVKSGGGAGGETLDCDWVAAGQAL